MPTGVSVAEGPGVAQDAGAAEGAGGPPPAPVVPIRKAKDPDAINAAKKRAKLSRLHKRLRKARAPEEKQAILNEIAELELGAGGKAQVAPEPAEKPAQPAETQAAPPPSGAANLPEHMDPARPGWPKADAVAQWVPLVAQAVAALSDRCEGTRYAFKAARTIEVMGQKIEVGGEEALIKALAPVAAKYLPTMITTPEGQALLAVGLVFGPPAAGHLTEWILAKWFTGAAA